jgi:hypothetical protein
MNVHMSPLLVPIVRPMKQSIPPQPTSTRTILILSYIPLGFPTGLFPSRFPQLAYLIAPYQYVLHAMLISASLDFSLSLQILKKFSKNFQVSNCLKIRLTRLELYTCVYKVKLSLYLTN